MTDHLSSLAGSDTTAIAIRAIFYFLVKTPQVYARLREEIDQAERDGKLSELVTYEESQGLRYLYVYILDSLTLNLSDQPNLRFVGKRSSERLCDYIHR